MEKGFDCDFVEPPPKIQLSCEVCNYIIREPHQVTCCGKIFCHSCIQQIKDNNKPCPSCKDKEFSVNPDKRQKRVLYGRKVYCTHQKDGCEWKGELGQLDAHLNKNPEPEKQFDGCQLAKVICHLCGNNLQRQHLQTHLKNKCKKRPFSCEYCHCYKSTYDDVIHSHWPVCGFFPLPCPNQCGSTPLRQSINSHIDNECPLTIINCDFNHIGCTEKFTRKDMLEHLRESLHKHISQLAYHHSSILAETKNLNDELDDLEKIEAFKNPEFLKKQTKQIEDLNLQFSQLTTKTTREDKKLKLCISANTTPSASPILTMTDFEQHKTNDDSWYSSPVYTHHQGYKICLSVDANGYSYGKGTYISVYVHFMRGEFDKNLKWPFLGTISFRLYDQRNKKAHHKAFRVQYNTTAPPEVCSRVKLDEELSSGWGFSKFVLYDQVKTKYMLNDTLYFQIYKCMFQGGLYLEEGGRKPPLKDTSSSLGIFSTMCANLQYMGVPPL